MTQLKIASGHLVLFWKNHCDHNNFLVTIATLFYIIASILINLVTAQQNPSIVHITPGQTVDLGDTVDLSCSVQYGADYPIIWTKLSDNLNNPPLFISRDAALTVLDNRYSIRHDDSSSTYTLQVSKVSSNPKISDPKFDSKSNQ